ncbi:probable lactoylglutathione lyase, chloroplastic [Tanacetum coccineum]
MLRRVRELDHSIAFYKKAFGLELQRKRDCPEFKSPLHFPAVNRCKLAMMGYGPEAKNCMLELTYNYGITECDKGNVYAQIALGSDDVYKTAEVVKLFGGHITREPGPLPNINTRITACLDPDG